MLTRPGQPDRRAGAGAGLASSAPPVAAALRFLTSYRTPDRPLLLAVSGGGDSVAMLRAFAAAARIQAGPRLLTATVDHGLRPEAAEDARRVAALAGRLGLAHTTLRWQGDKPATGLQAAARMARYALLAEAAVTASAGAVLLAHNSDDQHETRVMRADRLPPARHGGVRGLAGMAPATLFDGCVWFCRPFLGLCRAGLRQWLDAIGQDWLDDPSNADERFERVRVRRRIAGGLAGPPVDADAAQAARRRRAAAAGDVLADAVRVMPGPLAIVDPAGAGSVRAGAGLLALRALVAILGGGDRLPGEAAMEAALARLETGDKNATLGRVLLSRRGPALFVMRERRGLMPLSVAPGARAVWDGRYRIDNRGAPTPCLVRPADAAAVTRALDRHAGAGDAVRVPAALARRAHGADGLVLASRRAGQAGKGPDGDLLDALAGEGRAVSRRLAPFDVFLPLFDVSLANACAGLFGREHYPCPPVERG